MHYLKNKKNSIYLFICMLALLFASMPISWANINQARVRAKARGLQGFIYTNLVISIQQADFTEVKIPVPGAQGQFQNIQNAKEGSGICAQVGLKFKEYKNGTISCQEIRCNEYLSACPISGAIDAAAGVTGLGATSVLAYSEWAWKKKHPKIEIQRIQPSENRLLPMIPSDSNDSKEVKMRKIWQNQKIEFKNDMTKLPYALMNGAKNLALNYKLRSIWVSLGLISSAEAALPFGALELEEQYGFKISTPGAHAAAVMYDQYEKFKKESPKKTIYPFKASAPVGSSSEEEEEESQQKPIEPATKDSTGTAKP